MIKSINNFQKYLGSLTFAIRSAVDFYYHANTVHGLQSPFLYRLATETLENQTIDPRLYKIELRRAELLRDARLFHRVDFGQGSRLLPLHGPDMQINTWVRHSSIDTYYGTLLHHIIQHFKPKIILELGTAAGISSAYMAFGYPLAQIYTIDGDPKAVEIAQITMDSLDLSQVHIRKGSFSEILPQLLPQLTSVDCLFIDGHHDGQACKEYIDFICAQAVKKPSVIIIDDIRWSKDMYSAWTLLSGTWSVALDFYRFGVLIYNPDLVENVSVKMIARRFKPFTLGLFP